MAMDCSALPVVTDTVRMRWVFWGLVAPWITPAGTLLPRRWLTSSAKTWLLHHLGQVVGQVLGW